MNVQDLMSTDVKACRMTDDLNRAAQIMWEQNCGSLPVLDDDAHVIGMLTDRDICMAAYTQGRRLNQIGVSSACARTVHTCKLADSVQTAEKIMRAAQVRRVPVVDDDGKLRGVIALCDLAQHAHRSGRKPDGLSYESVARTLAAVSQDSSMSQGNSAPTMHDNSQHAVTAPASA
jgi:CBS domain-containing protein